MAGIGDKIGIPTKEFERQHELIKLPRTLMGGTEAMRAANTEYLPKKASEEDEDYQHRLKSATLVNMFKRTLSYMSGQVFQKPVRYQESPDGETLTYDVDKFTQFQEDVDTRGSNLSMFTKSVFENGVIDGVVFVLADYSKVQLERGEDGSLYYIDSNGARQPKNADADTQNNWRPYLVIVKAGQVIDAWLDVVNGKQVIKAFRYLEAFEKSINDYERETFNRVRVYFPDRWEVWEASAEDGKSATYEMVERGANPLGFIPVSWFIPGESITGLTARPALDDLAYLNASHWRAFADHEQLMEHDRRPVWKGTDLEPPKNDKGEDQPLIFGPGRVILGPAGSDLKNVGVDPNSVDKSLADLTARENYMMLHGLQLAVPQTGTLTATQASIAAASSDSTLKGWVQLLQDCMENVLRNVALWLNGTDGPALNINTEFRLALDLSLLTQLSSMASKGQLSTETLLEVGKRMDIFNDEFSVDEELMRLEEEHKQQESSVSGLFGFTDGNNNSNNAQMSEGVA